MEKILLLSLCCICLTGLFAQEKSIDTAYRNYFEFKEGEKVYLFGDNVNKYLGMVRKEISKSD